MTDDEDMLAHAYEDALLTGNCHWCEMERVVKEHVVVGYEHRDDCELSERIGR